MTQSVDQIDPAVFEKYNITPEKAVEIYESYLIYNRILQCSRKLKEDKEAIRIKNKEKYYCELCDKDVRICIKYHHERTQKHMKLAAQATY